MYKEIITNFRISNDFELLFPFQSIHNGATTYDKSFDLNFCFRKSLILELYSDYHTTDKDLIKWLLRQEIKSAEFGIPIQTLDICAFMLYKIMTFDDLYILFEAKFGTTYDAQCYLDIELIFGHDLGATKEYLKKDKTRKKLNHEILKTIKRYEENPDAKFKAKDAYISYFETKKIKSILADLKEHCSEQNHSNHIA